MAEVTTNSPALPTHYANVTKAIAGFLALVVPFCSTLSGFLAYQFFQYVSRVTPGSHNIALWIASVTLVTNLLGMVLEIIIFRTFAHNALINSDAMHLELWPLVALEVLNYLTASASRFYFARLASTMLRAPKIFLCLSGVFLLSSSAGIVVHLVGVNKQMMEASQSLTETLALRPVRLVGSQSLLVASALLWDIMITSVLYYNLFDPKRRCRFGSIDGKVAFILIFLFESFGLFSFASLACAVVMMILDFQLGIGDGRLAVVFGALNSLSTRFCGISILCSLLHKNSDRSRTDQKLGTNGFSKSSIATPRLAKKEKEKVDLDFPSLELGNTTSIMSSEPLNELIYLNADGEEELIGACLMEGKNEQENVQKDIKNNSHLRYFPEYLLPFDEVLRSKSNNLDLSPPDFSTSSSALTAQYLVQTNEFHVQNTDPAKPEKALSRRSELNSESAGVREQQNSDPYHSILCEELKMEGSVSIPQLARQKGFSNF